MTKYLFLILDRYEASLSETHTIKSNLNPKLVFRNCMLEIALDGSDDAEENYNDEIADQICHKNNLWTYDCEEQSFLLIKLES